MYFAVLMKYNDIVRKEFEKYIGKKFYKNITLIEMQKMAKVDSPDDISHYRLVMSSDVSDYLEIRQMANGKATVFPLMMCDGKFYPDISI